MVYFLQREYGQSISLRRTENDATDLVTGQQYSDLIIVDIKRAAFLPAQIARQFARTQTDTSRDQDFSYGGFFDTRTRFILINRRDIPNTFPIDQNMHLVFDSRRYQVDKIFDFEQNEALMLLATAMDGAIVDISQGPGISPSQPSVPSAYVVKIADYQILITDDARWFSNRGAPGSVTLTLPPTIDLTPGMAFRFVIETAQQLMVQANVGQIIQDGATTGGEADSSTIGSEFPIVWTGTLWFAEYTKGPWSIT